MKVLMQIRSNAFELSGGDTIQMLKTKEALEKLGIEVDISLSLRPDVSGYDVIHLFNLTRVQETYVQLKNAKAAHKPVVLSTIYWPVSDFEKNAARGLRGFLGRHLSVDSMERLKAIGKYILRGEKNEGARYLIMHSYSRMQREILEDCDLFLPNSSTEMDEIAKHLGFRSSDYIVVPNAVDTESIEKALIAEDDRYKKYKDWLVCIGRIDIRKNQMNLLDALVDSDYHLIVVGKKSPGHQDYANEVIKRIEANPNMEYIEQISNHEIYQLCKQCKVSVLPSWFETPGLVSLEAAAMGCNVVVSPKGTTRDYFGDYAFYCDVTDPLSIRKCIDDAYASNCSTELREKVLHNYTWDMAAKKTLEGYEKALGGV